MSLVGWLHCLILEKWPDVRDILWGPAVHSPLVTKVVCFKDALYLGGMGLSVFVGYYWSVGRHGWLLVQLVTRPCLV